MIKRYLVVFFLCLAGLFLGWKMLPQEREVALMHMKDKDYESALERYENQKDGGDLSVETAGTLARLYLQQGSVSRAIDVMEEFILANPDNVEARERLGQYYQYAQRSDDYVRNLEELAEITPDVKYVRELSHIYNYNSQYEKQMEVLGRLVKNDPANYEERVALARLQASSGKVEEAVETMRALHAQMPERFSIEEKVFFLNILMDAGKLDDVFTLANSWVEEKDGAEGLKGAVEFAQAIAQAGEPGRALELLRRFENRIATAPGLLVAIIKLERQVGDHESAYKRLQSVYALDEAKPLPQEVRLDFLELAVGFDNPELAMKLLDKVDFDVIAPGRLLDLVNKALERQQEALMDSLLAHISPGYMQSHEEIALAVALLEKDNAAVRRITKGHSYTKYSPAMRVRITELLVKTGYRKQAVAALKTFNPRDKENDAHLITLARLYADAGNPKSGLRFFEQVMALRPSNSAEYGFVLLQAANGKDKEVLAWLADSANPVTDQLYSDIYYQSFKRGYYVLALTASEYLVKKRPTDERRLNYANALIQNKRAVEAREMLQEISMRNRPWKAAYLSALTQIVQRGEVKGEAYARARRELASLLDEEFNAPGITDKERSAMLYTLLDMRAYKAALPELRKRAQQDPKQWGGLYIHHANKAGAGQDVLAYIQEMVRNNALPTSQQQEFIYAYLDAGGKPARVTPYILRLARERGGDWLFLAEQVLEDSGQPEVVLEMLRERANQPKLSAKELRYLGYSLEKRGDKGRAAVLFYRLAESGSANDKDIEQLLYLWGKNPPVGGLEWVNNQALQTTSPDRLASYVDYLSEAMAFGRVVAIVQSHEVSMLDHRGVKDAYMTALAEIGEREQLYTLLDQEIRRETKTSRLMKLSDNAAVAGFYTLAKTGYQRVLQKQPADNLALFRLGELAFYAGAFSEAEGYYQALLSREGDKKGQKTPDAHLYTAHLHRGLIAQRWHHPNRAVDHLEKALEILQAQPEKDLDMYLAEARALYNLGQTDAAEILYRSLQEHYPANRNVAADYAEILVAEKRYAEANRVLQSVSDAALPMALAAAEQTRPAYDASQRLRIELLNAQLLFEQGDIKASAARYEALRHENPENIYPVLALADIRSSLGNWRESFALLDNAEALAPYNEEIKSTRRRLQDQHRSSVKVDVEYRTVDNAEDAVRTTVQAEVVRDNLDKVGITYTLDNAQADNVTVLNNGTLGNFNSERQSVELYYEHQTSAGHWWHAGLVAADSGPGLVFNYTMPDYDGKTVLGAEYHVPYWDIIQGLVYDAARDRVYAGRTHRLSRRSVISMFGSLNRYSIEGSDHMANSGAIQLVASRVLSDNLRGADVRTTLQYTLDAEYMMGDVNTRTLGGTTFRPLPLRSREVHSLGLNLADNDFTDLMDWEVYGGYAIDRLGGSGPFFGGALRYEIARSLLGELRYNYSYDSNTFGGDVNRLGGFLKWYF